MAVSGVSLCAVHAALMLAHTGHWVVDIATYLVPLVVVIALLKLSDRRQRHRQRTAARSPDETD